MSTNMIDIIVTINIIKLVEYIILYRLYKYNLSSVNSCCSDGWYQYLESDYGFLC
jgi:hypothetical protein